ncbi:MAG: chemotaxis-specific protein-glutamate methyltransferase CheB [Verrucomicrobiales bacterium]
MKIGIVNDRPIAVEAIRRALAVASKHEIAWVASNGTEATIACQRDLPDLVLMDLIMPVMDGVEATRRIMASTPCPILVVTASTDSNADKVFEAISAGALDAVNTPTMVMPGSLGVTQLLRKIDALSSLVKEHSSVKKTAPKANNRLIAIGSSAGGPAAVAEVLKSFPADMPASVVVIQHLDEQFARGFSTWLQTHTKIPVGIADDGQKMEQGRVYIAATSDHLVLNSSCQLIYTPNPREYAYRPSVDAFMLSLVRYWTGDAVGVLLTGMGKDGALGLKAMRDAGYHTISQDQSTSAVYGMPKAAAALNAAIEVLPLPRIGHSTLTKIMELSQNSRRS